jgi:quinol monooxygenase YgiN
MDAGIKFVTGEVSPALDKVDGCRGLSLLVDRDKGEGILTSSWKDMASLDASDMHMRPMRDRGRDLIGGSMDIDTWEIAVMHRSSHGECCRVSWIEGPVDKAVDLFRFGIIPVLDDQRGFCSASLLIDKMNGVVCSTTCWATPEAMQTSRDTADMLRGRVAQESGGRVLDVREYELAYAHLHVPEMV